MELIHQTTPDDGPRLVLQEAGGDALPIVMPVTSFSTVLKGNFADFALVRPFVRALLARKPQSLIVDHLCNATADLARYALALGVRVSVRAGLEGVEIGDQPVDRRWGEALMVALSQSSSLGSGLAWPEMGAGYEQYALSSRNHGLLIQWADRVIPFLRASPRCLISVRGRGIPRSTRTTEYRRSRCRQ